MVKIVLNDGTKILGLGTPATVQLCLERLNESETARFIHVSQDENDNEKYFINVDSIRYIQSVNGELW